MLDIINRYQDLKKRGFGDRCTIWRKVNLGQFPEPQNFLGRPGWKESVIQQWLDDQPTMNSEKRSVGVYCNEPHK